MKVWNRDPIQKNWGETCFLGVFNEVEIPSIFLFYFLFFINFGKAFNELIRSTLSGAVFDTGCGPLCDTGCGPFLECEASECNGSVVEGSEVLSSALGWERGMGEKGVEGGKRTIF